MTLDDGSEATIEIKITHMLPDKEETTSKPCPETIDTTNGTNDTDEAFFDPDSLNQALATKRFETQTPGLVVMHNPEPADPITIVLDTGHTLAIGSLLKAKGTLSVFRNVFQMTLLRSAPLLTLDAETAVWEDYAQFCESTLCRPWILLSQSIVELERKEGERAQAQQGTERRQRAEDAKKREKRKQHEMKRRLYKEKEDAKLAAQRVILDGNPLDRPPPIPTAPKAMVVAAQKHRSRPPVLKLAVGGQLDKRTVSPPALAHPRVRELAGRTHIPKPPRLATPTTKSHRNEAV